MPSRDLIFPDVEASSLRPHSHPLEIGWARLSRDGAIGIDTRIRRLDGANVSGSDGLFALAEDAGKRLIEPYLPLLVDKFAERSVPCVSL